MRKSITEQLEAKISRKTENKYMRSFEKQGRYLGNGIYGVPGTNLRSTDTRELFLMFVAAKENVGYTIEDKFAESETD